MRRFLFPAFLVVACATGAAAGPDDDPFSAYERGDYTRAAQRFRSDAEQGNTTAQYMLGVMYLEGQGVSRNNQEAVKWFRKGTEQGVASAQGALGKSYFLGKGVPQDCREAVTWNRKGAEQGNDTAEF